MDTTKHTFERVSGKLVFRGTLEDLQDLALSNGYLRGMAGEAEWDMAVRG